MSRRSQSSLEYIATYGWAILIIVVVAALLYSMGIFSPSPSLSLSVTGLSPFTFITQQCGSGGFVLVLGNSAGSVIEIKNASIVRPSGINGSDLVGINQSVAPDSDFNLIFYNSSCPVPGVFYTVNIEINYTITTPFGPQKSISKGVISARSSIQPTLSFNEIGLPVGTAWTVTYAGETKTEPVSSISFVYIAGQRFSVKNVTIDKVSYFPSVSAGEVGNITSLYIDFIPLRDMYVSDGGSSTLSAIDTATNQVVLNISVNSNPQGVAVTPNGKFVYVTNHGNSFVSVVDTDTNTVVANVSVGINPVGVAIDPKGDTAYVTSGTKGGTLTEINTSDYTIKLSSVIGGGPIGIAVSPFSGFLYVAESTSDSVSVINASDISIIKQIPVGSYPTSVTISPNGLFAYVTNNDSNTVSVIDLSDNKVIRNISVGTGPYSAAVSPNDEVLYVVNKYSNNVYAINTSDYSLMDVITVGSEPSGVVVNPNGEYLYVSNYASSSVSVISASTYQITDTITAVKDPTGIADAASGSI